jgi:predicted nucleic acid-binding protein
MINHLIDTNVFFEVFKQNSDVKKFIESHESALDTTVYVECLQGSKAESEKQIIKRYLSHFPIFYHTPNISKKTISLIDQYSNKHGLFLPDAQIAAICLEYNLTLVTYNVRDFEFVKDLKCLKPM